jgi:ribosomal protein S18 acetylase RimI-like enzyme
MSYTVTLRPLRNTDYVQTKSVMRNRFCEADTKYFSELWYWRNEYASLCVEYFGQVIAFCLVVENKLEYLAVHEEFSSLGLGKVLVTHVLDVIEAQDYKCAHLMTADDPGLVGWYSRFGFEVSSSSCDSCGVKGDWMVKRFVPKRKAAIKAKAAISACF